MRARTNPRRFRIGRWGMALAVFPLLLVTAWIASPKGRRAVPEQPAVLHVAVQPFRMAPLPCASAVLVEAETGAVLYEQDADAPRPPASLVKMMVELVVFDELERGKLALEDTIRVSENASRMGGSQAFLATGDALPLELLMRAMTVASANDATVAIAEYVAGDRAAFVTLMNDRARRLGLQTTRYVNVHGLDETEERDGNVTTARDIARIGCEVLRHPHALEWASTRSLTLRGGKIVLQSTNMLLGRFLGLDGLKTGHTNGAGFNLCATAARDGRRFVSVVMGAPTRAECAALTAKLLDRSFTDTRLVTLSCKGKPIKDARVPVKWGGGATVAALATGDVRVLVDDAAGRALGTTLDLPSAVRAPVKAGQGLGRAKVVIGEEVVAEVPLVADSPVRAKGLGAVLAWLPGF